jgi:hypothetical protein
LHRTRTAALLCSKSYGFGARFAPVNRGPLDGENMAGPARWNAITRGHRQWLYLALVTIVVIPIVLIVTFLPHIQTAYVRQFVLPKWEKRFGFLHGRTTLQMNGGTHEVFAIATVVPGGAFARAGVLPGDVPVGYQHGFEGGFYSNLRRLESEPSVTFQFINSRNVAWRSVKISSP